MTSSNERGLRYESVKAACELLVANGFEPETISLREIRDETNGGSLSTIGKHRQRWLRERQDAALTPVHIDGSDLDGVRSAIEQLFLKMTSDMRAEVEASAAAHLASKERLELDLEEVLKSNELLRKESREALGRTDLLQQEVAAANLRADELAAANAKWREHQRMGLVDHRPLQQIPPEPGSKTEAHGRGSGEELPK